MSIVFFFLAVFLIFQHSVSKTTSHNPSTDSTSVKMSHQHILLLGDSLTQRSYEIETKGFGGLLNEWYIRSADIQNRGYSGYTTRWIRVMLPKLFPSGQTPKFSLTTLLLGSNDAASEQSAQHVPLHEYKDNLIFIINYLKSINPDMVIILITPPPNNQEKLDPSWDLRIDVNKYERVVVELATQMKIDLLSLWEGPFAIDPKLDLLDDGLHFDAPSNRKVAEGIKHIISTKHPNLLPEQSHSYPNFFELMHYKDPKAIVDYLESWSPKDTTTSK